MMVWQQLNFQDGASCLMEEFSFFHDWVMLILISILMFVGGMMMLSLKNKFINMMLLENQFLEMIWTIIPGVILIEIALPSLSLLYLFEESMNSNMTIKVLGHQWYWSYEFCEFSNSSSWISFDSYMLKDSSMTDTFRLLDVDTRLVIPFGAKIRMLVSSSDVLHSWTIPSLGVKADAIPGRLNQLSFFSKRYGIFFGQCSEICGANHSFMPIVLEVVKLKDFLKWIMTLNTD